jgi:hypothetical protein
VVARNIALNLLEQKTARRTIEGERLEAGRDDGYRITVPAGLQAQARCPGAKSAGSVQSHALAQMRGLPTTTPSLATLFSPPPPSRMGRSLCPSSQ